MKNEHLTFGSAGALLETYFLDPSREMPAGEKRPCVLVCPGGGYHFCSDREGEPIAMMLCGRGLHACVLRYPVAPDARFPEALCTAARAVAWIREHAEEYHVDPEQIAIMGFSAGGHLAASLGVFWNKPFLAELTGLAPEAMRPNKMVLSYPVITSGPYRHHGSFVELLGEDGFENEELRELVSLENQVTADTPPTFLWHTFPDNVVPVENSLYFALALRRAGVPFESHIYSVGGHGLSLAKPHTRDAAGNRILKACEGWIDLATDWLVR